MKKLDYEILFELMKNSKISDRKLAKMIGVSQPTVTRRRASLERDGYITYSGIPNFAKMGLTIMAFNFLSWNAEGEELSAAHSEDFLDKVALFLKEHPNVIFASTGSGMGMGRVSISLHKSYADHISFIRRLQVEWGRYIAKRDVFLVSLESDNVVRQLGFDQLIEYIRPG
ncbi:MAG: Lrp/AsnC family transcriptional regulator [Candidatus Bathyarchaeota archaeon]|nr:MAG: Lrp/AsnC family transcriptional regulator [Candidatus Bathyarchaeota archaeon]